MMGDLDLFLNGLHINLGLLRLAADKLSPVKNYSIKIGVIGK